MCEITTNRYSEQMVDSVMEEYVSKFLNSAPHIWGKNQWCKAMVIHDVRIVYTFQENRVTFQGNLLKARAMVQIPQCKKEVEEENKKRRGHTVEQATKPRRRVSNR